MVHRVRVILVLSGALALAACESAPDWTKPPDWMKVNTDAFKPQPYTDTVRFESEPPGAEAKTSTGQTCRTPCALALPANAPITVTFTLNGYRPETERIELIASTAALDDAPHPAQLQPNPVTVELTPAPPPARPGKKPAPKTKPAAKQAAKPAAHPKPAPMTAAPVQQAPAPWPSAPPPQR